MEEIQKINVQVVIPAKIELFQVDIVYVIIAIMMMDLMNNVVHVILIGTFIFIKIYQKLDMQLKFIF